MERLKFKTWVDEERADGVSSITFQRNDEKKFVMNFAGNLDLYFNLKNFGDDPSFLIGKDNYAVYEIFDKLYHDVMNGIPFLQDESYNLHIAERTGLIKEDEIIWRSDDYSHDVAPYFKITKYPNSYLITFGKPEPPRELDSSELLFLELNSFERKNFTVRIRNSGSDYGMFHVPFMQAYHSLFEISMEYPQVHIEEYLLEQRVQSGESLEKILKKR